MQRGPHLTPQVPNPTPRPSFDRDAALLFGRAIAQAADTGASLFDAELGLGGPAELIKTVALLDDLTTDKQAQPADAALLGVSVTMTTEQAVTKVQALLSRVAPATDGGGPPHGGTGGYISIGKRYETRSRFSTGTTTLFGYLRV